MNAGMPSVLDGLPSAVDRLGTGVGKGADDRLAHFPGDRLHCLEISGRAGWKARLDDVHAHALELAGDPQLLLARHAGACGLLAIAQGGIQEDDSVFVHGGCSFSR